MSPSSASSVDWKQLYESLALQGDVPYASSQAIDSSHAVFQAMYLDLNEIKATLSASGFDPPLVAIYADVLNVPANGTWLLQDSALFVVARRIQTDGRALVNLDYRHGHSASLVVFTTEIDGRLDAVAITSGTEATTFPIVPGPGGGAQLSWSDGPAATSLGFAQGIAVAPTQVFQQSLITEFIFASLLYDQQPVIALAQLSWLKDWTGSSPALLEVFLRSCSLLALLSAQVNAQQNGAAFVPYLTQAVYTTQASAFVDQAGQYESTYRTLSTQKAVDDQFIALAKTLLANQTSQSDYVTKLLAQAKLNYDHATDAVAVAQKNFNSAQMTAQLTQIQFEQIGVPDWKREKIIEAVISLATALITFGVGIAGMLVGDEAAGAASAKAAVSGAEAVAKAAEAGSEIAKSATQAAKVMKQLKDIVEALQKVYEFIQKLVEAAQNIEQAQEYADAMKQISLDTGGADLSATYAWQIYQQNADATLAGPVKEGIGYADDLKLAIDNVAVYGQALAAAQHAAILAGQQYAQVRLQQALAQQQQQQLEQYVRSLQTGEQPLVAMMQQFYQRYIDAKSSLYAAIQGYRASYFYWALEPSMIHAKIVEGVDTLDTGLSDLTRTTLDKTAALQHFTPPPQVLARKPLVIDDPAVIDQLRKTGTAKWAVTLDSAAFAGLDRVRLTLVRAWLEGATPADHEVALTLATSGSYRDRLAGTAYQFTSAPLSRTFEYSVSAHDEGNADWKFDDGSFGYVDVDGAVDHEVSYAYFEPTPFAEWQLTVKSQPHVDLSRVTKITLIFAGSVIPQKTVSRSSEPALAQAAGGRR